MKKAIIIVLGLATVGIGLLVAKRRGWFEGLDVFKPIEIHTS